MAGHYLFIAAIIVGSFATLYVIAKMWAEVFWKNNPASDEPSENRFKLMKTGKRWLLVAPIALLAFISLYIGVGAESITAVVQRIAAELMDTTPYIQAVLAQES